MTKKQTLLVPSLEALRGAQELSQRGGDPRVAIYESRVAGHSIREIAAMYDKTADEVEAIIFDMAEASRKRIAAELSIAQIVELDRLDQLMSTLWTSATTGDVGCIDRVLNISKERRKLLGLDAPDMKLTLTADASDIDLSGLTLDEIKAYEAIQKKLADKKRASAKGGPASRYSGGAGSSAEVVDAEFTESPPRRRSPKPTGSPAASSDPRPAS